MASSLMVTLRSGRSGRSLSTLSTVFWIVKWGTWQQTMTGQVTEWTWQNLPSSTQRCSTVPGSCSGLRPPWRSWWTYEQVSEDDGQDATLRGWLGMPRSSTCQTQLTPTRWRWSLVSGTCWRGASWCLTRTGCPSRPIRTPPSCSSALSGQPFAPRWWPRPTSSPKTPSTGCWERSRASSSRPRPSPGKWWGLWPPGHWESLPLRWHSTLYILPECPPRTWHWGKGVMWPSRLRTQTLDSTQFRICRCFRFSDSNMYTVFVPCFRAASFWLKCNFR